MARTLLFTLAAFATPGCSDRPLSSATAAGSSDATSTTEPAPDATTSTDTSRDVTEGGHPSTTTAASTETSSTTEASTTTDPTSSSSTTSLDVPEPYGPCGSCGPDEDELDSASHCMCAPHCGEGLDCPDPGTGADPACATEVGLCVLLCDDPEQCPEGMQCPDPRTLPEGAQGYCYYP